MQCSLRTLQRLSKVWVWSLRRLVQKHTKQWSFRQKGSSQTIVLMSQFLKKNWEICTQYIFYVHKKSSVPTVLTLSQTHQGSFCMVKCQEENGLSKINIYMLGEMWPNMHNKNNTILHSYVWWRNTYEKGVVWHRYFFIALVPCFR